MLDAKEAQALVNEEAFQACIDECIEKNREWLLEELDRAIRVQCAQGCYYCHVEHALLGSYDPQIFNGACSEMVKFGDLGYRLMKGVYHSKDNVLELVLNWETDSMIAAKLEAESKARAEAACN